MRDLLSRGLWKYWIDDGYFSLDDAKSSRPGVNSSRITEVMTPGRNEDEGSVLILNSDGWPRWRGWMDLFPHRHRLKGDVNFKVRMNLHHYYCGEGCNRNAHELNDF